MAIQSVLTPPDQSAARSTKSSQDGQGVQRSIANPPSEDIPFTVKDIGGGNLPTLLNSLLEEQLNDPQGHQTRHLPALFFSDDIGLSMWSKITHLPRYYQTRDEIELLRAHGDEIVEQLRMGVSDNDGLIVVDLGAGDIRKVVPLLMRLDSMGVPVTYHALDLSQSSLKRAMDTLKSLSDQGELSSRIKCHALWGSFSHAIEYVRGFPQDTPRLFMSLGSMFGNDYPESAISLLHTWRCEMRKHDRMLIGMDGATDFTVIKQSYHDEGGLFEKFIINGFVNSNSVRGVEWFKPSQWTISRTLVQTPHLMHSFVLTATKDIYTRDSEKPIFPQGERIECYRAFKLGIKEMKSRFSAAGLSECCEGWQSPSGRINQYLLRAD